MAELFQKSRSTINEHILNFYEEKELDTEESMRKIGISDFSTKPTYYYNLEMFIRDAAINVIQVKNEDYFCLTDLVKVKDGDFFVADWLRNRNTLEYLGIWEQVNNPSFN